MAKMANTLKELDRSAGEAYKKGRISFQVGRFEEALTAYGEAADAWKEMEGLLFEKGKKAGGKEYLGNARASRSITDGSIQA